ALLSASSPPRPEHLPNLALREGFTKLSAGIFTDHRAPERHGWLVVKELDDLPGAGEAVEDEPCGVAPDAQAPRPERHEEFGHAKVDLLALVARRAADER